MKKALYLVIAICLLFISSTQVIGAGLPPPPSQEELDRLRQMGDENLRRYGDGGVSLVDGEYVITASITPIPPTSTPTPIPLPSSTPTPKLTSVPRPQKESVTLTRRAQTMFSNMWLFISDIFFSNKEKAK